MAQIAINYLAIPLILAMLAYAAVSFPETTANTLYTVLEFIKEHPTASSIGIIAGAGALLGPDLLAGTAVAGAQQPRCVEPTFAAATETLLGASIGSRGGSSTTGSGCAALCPCLLSQLQPYTPPAGMTSQYDTRCSVVCVCMNLSLVCRCAGAAGRQARRPADATTAAAAAGARAGAAVPSA